MRIKELLLLLMLSLAILPLTLGGDTGTTLAIPPWTHCFGMHRVFQFHLNIYSGYKEKFSDPQGLFCTKLDSKDNRNTRKDDDELTVFGLNTGNNSLIYNRSYRSIGIVGNDRESRIEFDMPRDIAGDNEGNLFIADTGNNRIVRLKYDNDELLYIGEISGLANDPFSKPEGVCVGNGKVYIADTGNDRIVITDYNGQNGIELIPFCDTLSLWEPSTIALASDDDRWLYYNDYFVAVVDSAGKRLWKIPLDEREAFVERYSFESFRGRFNHLDIDYYGHIYITDTSSDLIHKFDRHLNYITSIGDGRGGDDVSFDQPRGISIYRRFGQVFISEISGAQYFWIGTDLLDLDAGKMVIDRVKGSCSIQVAFVLTEHSIVDIYMEDQHGERRLDIACDYLLPGGQFKKRLEVPCPDMRSFAKCKLKLVVIAKPTYSAGDYLVITKRTGILSKVFR